MSSSGKLQAHAGEVDVAMLYVCDRDESLGEAGLYLHGMAYPVGPLSGPTCRWF